VAHVTPVGELDTPLVQTCQTGGPIACLMQPTVTYLNKTVT
jgi:hypothetical protein